MCGASKKLKQLIGTKCLKNWRMDGEELNGCTCERFQDLINPKIGHVHLKAIDLPEAHARLKRLLTISNKNPVYLGNKDYLGRCVSYIRQFLGKLGVTQIWSEESNDDLLSILRRPYKLRERTLEEDNVRETLKNYKGLAITQLDKNNGTWAVTCEAYYKHQHFRFFGEDDHYEMMTEQIKQRIEKALMEADLAHLAAPLKKWQLGNAKLLPKNKDIERFRPLVSYLARFIGKPVGKIIARCLSLIERKLTLK